MKSPFWLALIVIGSLCLGGCTTYPTYSDAVRHFPPIQPGNGRVVIYVLGPNAGAGGSDSPLGGDTTGFVYAIKIDGQTVGHINKGFAALYFDRHAGNCMLVIKTGIVTRARTVLNLEDGQAQYIQIAREKGFFGKFLLLPMDPDQASRQLALCFYLDKNFLKTHEQ